MIVHTSLYEVMFVCMIIVLYNIPILRCSCSVRNTWPIIICFLYFRVWRKLLLAEYTASSSEEAVVRYMYIYAIVTAGVLGITECVNPIQVSYEAQQWFNPCFYNFVLEIFISSVVLLSMFTPT